MTVYSLQTIRLTVLKDFTDHITTASADEYK